MKDDSGDWVELIPEEIGASNTKYFNPLTVKKGGVKKGAVLIPKECSQGDWQRNICD